MTNTGNRRYMQAMQELRRSSASTPIPARKVRKQGTRRGAKAAAIKAAS